jgi:uncharacterized membrane protein YgdD (TMEM256/DUF423 family)
MKANQILAIATILGALAVILGAFGAHGLTDKISPEKLETFKLGVSYQYYHVAALLACGILSKISTSERLLGYAAVLFIIGIFCFSGSLYLLSTRELTGLGTLTPVLGPMTPIGGLFLIGAWVMMGIAVMKIKN